MGFVNELNMNTVNEIKSQLNVIEGEDYKDSLVAVSHVTSEILQQTLGPYAKTTILDDGVYPYTSKDGWSLVKRLSFNNPIYQTLFSFIRNISFSIIEKVGDGTTTAIIAANAFIEEMAKVDLGNIRQADFVKIMTDMKDKIVETLEGDEYKKNIDYDGDFSDIRKVAYISSNGNDEIADMIQEIYQKTKNPNIYVGLDYQKKTSCEIQEGYKFDCNLLNLKMYANSVEGYYTNKERTLMLMLDHNVNYAEHRGLFELASGYAASHGCDIIIMAPHFDDIITNVIGTMMSNMRQQNRRPNLLMVQIPLSMEIHKSYYRDLAVLTKSLIVDYSTLRLFNRASAGSEDETPESFEDQINGVKPSELSALGFANPNELIIRKIGSTDNIIITKDSAIFQDYDTSNPLFKAMIDDIDKAYKAAKTAENKSSTTLNKKFMDVYMRKTKISGNMGAIKVGAATELEQLCLKDQIDDSVLACRSAYENGYVMGLNMTTLHIINDLICKYILEKTELQKDMMACGYHEDAEGKPMVHVTKEHLTRINDIKSKIAKIDQCITVLDILKNTFKNTSKKVLDNKYHTDAEVWVNGKFTTDKILDMCIFSKRTFNIVSEEFEDADNLTVINSVKTDVEILNAVTSILTLVLTSSQMLSINHHYDKKINREKLLNDKAEEYKYMALGIVSAFNDDPTCHYQGIPIQSL